jgi:branched-subunit amino acid aminotransferase/4-amino-4-deoxychorismate lyase
MANFENARWAPGQMRYFLHDKSFEMFEAEATAYAATRSAYYASFLCFEGIRYFCHRNKRGKLELVLVNWDQNLERFRQSMAFNLSSNKQSMLPTREELEDYCSLINIFLIRRLDLIWKKWPKRSSRLSSAL